MRSFGAIFAALTLAFSASAASIYPRDGNVATNNLGGVLAVAGTVANDANDVSVVKQVNKRQLSQLTSEVTKVIPRGGDDECSYPGIVVGVTKEIVEIAASLDVALEGNVDVDAVEVILGKIKVCLDVAVEAVQKLDLKAETVLYLDGKVQVLAQIALCISALIHVAVGIVAVVIKVTVLAEISAVVSICAAICVNVSAIIAVGISLVPGLLVAVVRLCADIKLDLALNVCAAIAGILHI